MTNHNKLTSPSPFNIFSILLIAMIISIGLAVPNPVSAQAEAVQDTTGYASVNGIKMYYEVYGQGNPLVLIHGGGSTIQTSFGRIIPKLSRNNRVIAVELQNHGHSGFRKVPQTFEQDADVVRPEHAVKMFRLIQNSHLSIIPGGHGEYLGEITTINKSKSHMAFVFSLIQKFLDKPMPKKK